MAPAGVLMVAEKPSIAQAVARALARGQMNTRRGAAGSCPVHEFPLRFRGEQLTARVTSVTGHVYSLNFTARYQSWDKTDPVDLFAAETVKEEANPKSHMCKHLQNEARGCDYLVLWLDCDREGENIAMEVVENAQRQLNRRAGQQIFRAKFSAIAEKDIVKAMANLGVPNENEALSVDARQEIDLKVGVAFTRFQTNYFQGRYGDLDSRLISYGPCQTPTCGFAVQRHDEIQGFQAETFWTLAPTVTKGGTRVRFEWARGRIFDHEIANMFLKEVVASRAPLKVLKVSSKEDRKPRPVALNTVEMLRKASSTLGMGPSQTMHVAERLYIQGFISYPRTESSAYPASFDIGEALGWQRAHPVWGEYVRSLIAAGPAPPKGGHDAGDHPPITPVRMATQNEIGDGYRLYDMICRHFLASVSPDCKLRKTKVEASIGDERFVATGRQVTQPGWTALISSGDEEPSLPEFSEGETFAVGNLQLSEGKTSPPDYLTESELISLMERHGIGTDASIATHINNVVERNYCKIEGSRKVVPTALGIALVHGFHKIDPELVLPTVRSNIEKNIDLIAHGSAGIDEVVSHALGVFEAKFRYFVNNIGKMDELFEATFSPLAASGKPMSRCGKCLRYLKYIALKPQRLFCAWCDETYKLPQGGMIKIHGEQKCPVDNFEIVLYTTGAKGQTYPLCPRCYNDPPFDHAPSAMACTACPHPSCQHSLIATAICPCADDNCAGTLCLELTSGPKWKAGCNVCNYLVWLPKHCHKVATLASCCEICGANKLRIDFHKDHSPLPDGKTVYKSCIVCDPVINEMCEARFGTTRHPMYKRGGGRGGRRGGRGRGRGRGKGYDHRLYGH